MLSDTEILWANPHLRGHLPTTLQRALLYLRKQLKAESPEHLLSLTNTLSKHDPQSTPISSRWQALLHIFLQKLPYGPTPLQLIQNSKQPDIATSISHATTTLQNRPPSAPRLPPIHIHISKRSKKRKSHRNTQNTTPTPDMLPHHTQPHSPPQHNAPVTRIITQCPTLHTRHSTRPSRTTNYLVEWETITCPYHIAQAHLTRGTPITHISITPQFATDRPIIPAELDPPCFQCHLGEGDSRDPNLLQCERCLRWIHAHCLPQPTPNMHDTVYTNPTHQICYPKMPRGQRGTVQIPN